MRVISFAVIIVVAPAFSAFAGDKPRIAEYVEFEGFCEASGALSVPEGSFNRHVIVVDNESNVLRAYNAETGERQKVDRDVSVDLGLDPTENDHDIDLEAAAWLDGTPYFVGSLGRSKKGNIREARHFLFSLDVSTSDDQVHFGDKVSASQELVPALANLGGEAGAALKAAIGPDEKRKNLAPKIAGLNLEGMTAAADGTSLWLGFRNPIPDGKALLVKLRNPSDVVFDEAYPDLDPSVTMLELGGRGIRAMEYAPKVDLHFIVAGHACGCGDFALYRWVEGSDPEEIKGASTLFDRLYNFRPEAIMIDDDGETIRVFSDDEDYNCQPDEDAAFGVLTLTVN